MYELSPDSSQYRLLNASAWSAPLHDRNRLPACSAWSTHRHINRAIWNL